MAELDSQATHTWPRLASTSCRLSPAYGRPTGGAACSTADWHAFQQRVHDTTAQLFSSSQTTIDSTLLPFMQASAGQRLLAKQHQATAGSQVDGHESELYRREAYQGNPARQLGARCDSFLPSCGLYMQCQSDETAEQLRMWMRV